MFTELIKIVSILIHLILGLLCSIYILYINNNSKLFLIEWWSLRLLKIFHVKLNVNDDLKGILSKKRVFRLDNKFDRISDESLKYLTTEVNNILKLKKNINPVLSTHYERDYFISSNKKIRCTLDDNLESIQLGYLKNYLIKKKFFRLVLEMKYNSEYDEYVRKNLKNLSDSRLSKNSKYLLSAIDDKFITN